MKKSILALSLTALVFSCKKDKTNEFTPTDVTGTTVVKGTLTRNIITPNNNGSWNTGTRIPAAGVAVSIKVNKNSLYPNSSATGADVYSATSDNNGNYSISVKSNANGVNAAITIDGFNATLDTINNGVTKTGFLNTFTGLSTTRNLIMGQNIQLDHAFSGQNLITNPSNTLKTGLATITGSVGVSMVKEVMSGTLVTLTSTNVPVAGRIVYLNFTNDPTTLGVRSYTALTNENGYYAFDITTVAANTPGTAFTSQSASIWVADYATTRDTLKANNTIKTGRAGVFSQQTATQNNIYINHIRNANHFVYSAFTPN